MPTYRVRARVNGEVRRSWGDSVDEATARSDAQAQLDKLYGPGRAEIISVEEIEPVESLAEQLVAIALDIPADHVPDDVE